MDASTAIMRCPHLDRLNRDLIEAYRIVEDRDIFTLANGTESVASEVAVIHKAIREHRANCPICSPGSFAAQKVTRTAYILR